MLKKAIRKADRICREFQSAIKEVDESISQHNHSKKRDILKRLEDILLDQNIDRVKLICKKLSKLNWSHIAQYDMEEIKDKLKDLSESWEVSNKDLQDLITLDQNRHWDTTPGDEETLDLVKEQQSWNSIKKMGVYFAEALVQMHNHLEQI